MSILDEREEYLKNPYFVKHEYGDFTPFYITITICSVIGGFIFLLNIVFCWCSRHRAYWQDRHTGNRYIQSLWTVLPHKTPPLDLTELESIHTTQPIVKSEVIEYHDTESQGKGSNSQEYLEMHKRESEI
ncbi:uncharacterized protein LOC124954711 isoform X2 [Vespa velutina]|uniref:uncharacterized protein LOC124430139 n=1 Tax=Vespa crabro TaxID=7445 RepID=UPI001F025900|nr:uncharacterized protein LOC124430139 [Vespa crabro]XP_047363992.1 uncharacterized protein LOC124954711 isoform X2 [Vespa velutina]